MTITTIEAREAGLHKALTKGQAIMISIGGALGTTIFLSSGIALGYAGPAVMVSYAIAGLIAVVMVFSLSEMAVVHPTAGSFGAYAELYLNPWAGFVVRYTYWFAEMVATGFEAVAAGIYMTYWFPEAPVWMWSIGFAVIVLWVNSRSVGNFGTVEYWFSWIKVSAVVLFIILGMAHIFGLGSPAVGLHNLYALPGGFFPHGFHCVWMAVILGMLSFIGIEVVAVTSGEVAEPEKAIPAALRGMAARLILFFVLALGVIAALIPWNQVGASVAVTGSPFVKVLGMSGIPYAAGIMNFVIVSAALSGMNTNVYLCSRMLFSRAAAMRRKPWAASASVRRAGQRGGPYRRLRPCFRGPFRRHPQGLRLPARHRPVQHDRGLDHHTAQPPAVQTSPQGGRPAGPHALLSGDAADRPRPPHRPGDHHGVGPELEPVLDRHVPGCSC